MSVTDVVWLLPVLAAVALDLKLRSSAVALLLGLALVLTSFVLFGYSMDNYSNNDCQPAEPCPSGERVIDIVEPAAFLSGATLVVLGFVRTVWNYVSGLRTWRRHRT